MQREHVKSSILLVIYIANNSNQVMAFRAVFDACNTPRADWETCLRTATTAYTF